MNISRLLSLLIIFVLGCSVGLIQAKDKDEDSPLRNYSIEGSGRPASQGTYIVKVSVNTKNSKLADKEIAKCAVHGILFKGYSGEGSHSEKPLARSAAVETEHHEFFADFFSSPRSASYASPIQSSRQVTKSGKQYVISEIVEVKKDLLKKDLQNAGILKSLTSGF